MLEKLLSSVYSALDKSPEPKIAIRAQHADGIKWSIAKRNLTLGTETGANLGSVDLDSLTISGLADWLIQKGCSVLYRNTDLAERSASVLLSGSGNQSQSNGNAFEAYDSLLWSLLDSYAYELEGASDNIGEALLQLGIKTASGEWLDYWGEYFGFPRESRSDAVYREYIVEETLRNRDNALAIEKAVKQLSGEDVFIREPWKDIFILGESAMDGSDHLHGGHYYTYGVIQPVGKTGVDWNTVLPIIKRNKAGGVVIADPQNTVDPAFVPSNTPSNCLFRAELRERINRVKLSLDPPLDEVSLGNDGYILNHPFVVYSVMNASTSEMAYVADIPAPRTVAKASVCLSDGYRLGEVNSVLGRGWTERNPAGMQLSGGETEALRLSDGKATVNHHPVEEVIDQRNMTDVAVEPVSSYTLGKTLLLSTVATSVRQEALDNLVLSQTEVMVNHKALFSLTRGSRAELDATDFKRAWGGEWNYHSWVERAEVFKITHISE